MSKVVKSQNSFDATASETKQAKLTLRETQCLTQFMHAKSLIQIAKSLGIKKRTAHFYLVGVQKKIALLTKQAALGN